nr:Chain B, proline rich peptide [Homo sapiens]
ELAPPKPPLPE